MLQFLIQENPIEEVALFLNDNENDGARVMFTGHIRKHNNTRRVVKLEYHCYEALAYTEGQSILQEAIEKFSIHRAGCVHRIGTLHLKDIAIRVETTAMHRSDAFSAAMYIMDEIKTRVPIWKKEFYDDGESMWLH